MENIKELQEIIATLNLESETTQEIIKELIPLLWWKVVIFPFIELAIVSVFLIFFAFVVFKLLTK